MFSHLETVTAPTMNPLLLLSQIGFGTLAVAINPMVKGDYRIEHPNMTDLSDLQSKLSSDSYFESFQYSSHDEFIHNWVISELEMEHVDETMSRAFPGLWKLESPYLVPGFSNDLALVLGSSQTRSAIAHKLDHEISVKTKEKLVVQYEVKLQKMLECGGAYMKLLKTNADDLSQYDHSADDYVLVFGPDSCSMYTNEVHFILKRENPISEEFEDKYLTEAPLSGLDQPITRLYTLILDSADQSFEIRIDGEVVKAGNLLAEGTFRPSLNPPREIEDPSASQPADWDSRSMIPDSTAIKPEDWDENEPKWIPDPMFKKPEEWDDSISEYIEDESRSKPDWWNDKVDGRWIAPLIVNPSCYTKQGCGKWRPKMVENEKYRGTWKAEMIPNPNYQGEWKAPLIANPNYYEDKTPANIDAITAISFDIWSSASDISFDNIYVGKSIEEAELVGNSTFLPKLSLEKKELEVVMEKAHSEDVNEVDTSEESSKKTPYKNVVDKENHLDYLKLIDEKIKSCKTLQTFIAWFLQVDDLYKGFLISAFMVVVVSISCMGMLKFLMWSQGIDLSSSSNASRKPKKIENETSDGPSANTVTEIAASTGYSTPSSKVISQRTIQLQGDSDFDEELEISIVEESGSASDSEDK